MEGICKLCGLPANLVRKSHIIPQFMYKPLFGAEQHIFLRSLNDTKFRGKPVQTGIFEADILCKDCDNVKIGRLEHYMSSLLFSNRSGVKMDGSPNPDGSHSIKMSGIDYCKFKLFLLSLVWRAHISRHRFFQRIDIAANEADIRQILLAGESLPAERYRVAVMAVLDNRGGLVRAVTGPDIQLLGRGRFAIFFINGFLYLIDLDPASDFGVFDRFHLTKEGSLEILLIPGQKARDTLTRLGFHKESIIELMNGAY